MASHCLGTTSFIEKESIKSNECVLIIVGLERAETVKTEILFVDIYI
jgi:hypothetical protein